MAKFKVTFTRSVRQFHEAVVEAPNEQAVEQMYEDGALGARVTESRILDEDGPVIVRVSE